MTGPLRFNANGQRTDFSLDVLELKKTGLLNVSQLKLIKLETSLLPLIVSFYKFNNRLINKLRVEWRAFELKRHQIFRISKVITSLETVSFDFALSSTPKLPSFCYFVAKNFV